MPDGAHGFTGIRAKIRGWRTSFEHSPVAKRMARGALWSIGGAGVARGFGLLGSVVTARVLGRQEFGRLGVVIATIGMFQLFAGAGMAATATKFVAEFRSTDPRRAGGVALLAGLVGGVTALFIGVGVWLYAPEIAEGYLGDATLAGPLRIASLGLAFVTLNGAQTGTLAGLEAFESVARTSLVSGVASLLFSVVGVLSWGMAGVVWATVASAVAQWVLTGFAVRAALRGSGIVLGWRLAIEQRRLVWSFALPAVMSSIMVVPVNWWAMAMVARVPNGFFEVGAFTAATQWLAIIFFVPTRLGAVSLPVLSERLARQDRAGAITVLKGAFLANAAVVVPLVLAVGLFSRFIMAAYGPEFADAWLCLVIVAVAAAVSVMISVLNDFIAASANMWAGFAMNAGWAAVFIAVIYLLNYSGTLGAVSLASARLGAYVVHSIWVYWYARRQLGAGAVGYADAT